MATPTITNIAPNSAWAGGGDLIVITGTHFREPVVPAYGDSQVVPHYPTVTVLFGGVPAPKVYVESSTSLVVETPPCLVSADLSPLPSVNITIQNIDDNGNPISGEIVTFSNRFTFTRPTIVRENTSVENPLQRIVRIMLRTFKREILLQSGMTTETDYSEDGIFITTVETPSLYIVGPIVTSDAYGAENEEIEEDLPANAANIYPSSVMHTLTFELNGFTDKRWDVLDLLMHTRKLFRKHPYLLVQADIPANTFVRLPWIVIDEPLVATENANANLASFKMTFEVRRVSVLYLTPYLRTKKVSNVELQVQLKQGSLVEIVNM
jgi:hypothetical protein